MQMMLARFDTYTEYSPSGNGIHILGKLNKDRLPIYYDEKNVRYRLEGAYYYKNSKLNLEIYPGLCNSKVFYLYRKCDKRPSIKELHTGTSYNF